MDTDLSLTPELYEVRCYTCKIQFNALESVWCNCLVSQHTLICPGCLTCFCKAPTAFKIKFWASAPQILWDREIELHKHDLTLKPNPEPEDAVHPLILIVDDETDILKLACRTIQDLGYSTIYAQNGIAGLEMARRYRPELVLSDALMPRMDGREMCRQIKKDKDLKKTKVVIMTLLYTQSKYKTEAYREFMVDAYLNKPLEYNQLREILQRYLG
jgi:CheY-like chemotaxis protein